MWHLKLGDAEKRAAHVDERGVNLWRKRPRARSKKGQPAHVHVPSQRNLNVTNICGISPVRGAFFGQALEGGINTERFKSFMEGIIKEWEKESPEGLIVVLDNARSHSKSMLEELMDGAPHNFKFLPPWSPFLSPIEEAFAERKSKMRKVFAERRREIIAIGDQPRRAKTRGRVSAAAPTCRDAFRQLGPTAPCYRRVNEYFARCIAMEDIES